MPLGLSTDLAIIGAGAAGLAAAIFAGEATQGSGPLRIALLDSAKTIGAKILVSGGGRCNVTHEVVTPIDFFGNRRIIKNVLAALPVEQTIKWFASLGVDLKREETGKLFPVTDKARTILTALVNADTVSGPRSVSSNRAAKSGWFMQVDPNTSSQIRVHSR